MWDTTQQYSIAKIEVYAQKKVGQKQQMEAPGQSWRLERSTLNQRTQRGENNCYCN